MEADERIESRNKRATLPVLCSVRQMGWGPGAPDPALNYRSGWAPMQMELSVFW
jgi:hypothetical protein